jgi:peptide/nickel transport system substrate-binding protein
MVGWQLPVGMDPDYTARCHSKEIPEKYDRGSNYVQYENPVLDKLLEEGVVTQDRGKRKGIYWQIQKILDDEMPFVPIFEKYYIFGRKSDLAGYKVNAYSIDPAWNVQEWYWKE